MNQNPYPSNSAPAGFDAIDGALAVLSSQARPASCFSPEQRPGLKMGDEVRGCRQTEMVAVQNPAWCRAISLEEYRPIWLPDALRPACSACAPHRPRRRHRELAPGSDISEAAPTGYRAWPRDRRQGHPRWIPLTSHGA